MVRAQPGRMHAREVRAEALQVLEHALVVRAQSNQDHGFDYAITRRGRAALEHGEIESILTATIT
jgi:hypothetical protein